MQAFEKKAEIKSHGIEREILSHNQSFKDLFKGSQD